VKVGQFYLVTIRKGVLYSLISVPADHGFVNNFFTMLFHCLTPLGSLFLLGLFVTDIGPLRGQLSPCVNKYCDQSQSRMDSL